MSLTLDADSIYSAITRIKQQSPLIHHVTNLVVMQTNANCLLALGGSPLMAHAIDELDEITTLSQALVLNIGTLDDHWIKSYTFAQSLAQQKQKPIILDPVGAGASSLRTNTAKTLLSQGISALRGNASEILALQGSFIKSKGVDSLYHSDSAIDAAQDISSRYDCTVIVSGECDHICHGDNIISLRHGDPLLTKVTGMGCSATSLIAAFLATQSNPIFASICGVLSLNIAAEKAALTAKGPGSFYTNLLDQLANLTLSDFQSLHINYQK